MQKELLLRNKMKRFKCGLSSDVYLYILNAGEITPTQMPAPLVKTSYVQPTNEDVEVTIEGWDVAVFKFFRIDGGLWQDYINPIIMKVNGIIEAQGSDQDGNKSIIGKLEISNIDKIPPSSPIIGSTDGWTNALAVPVTITAGTDGASGVAKEGITTITARCVDNAGNISLITSKVVKIDKVPERIKITADNPHILKVGMTKQLTVKAYFNKGFDTDDYKNVIWTSSNPSIVKVDVNGLLTAVGHGKVWITATDVTNSKISDKSLVISFDEKKIRDRIEDKIKDFFKGLWDRNNDRDKDDLDDDDVKMVIEKFKDHFEK